MSYDALLIHTVEVRRQGGEDRFGQPLRPNPSGPADNVYPGRLSTIRGSERYRDGSRGTVSGSSRIFLPLGVDISESDWVTVRNQDGDLLVEGANVVHVSRPEGIAGPHHIEVEVSTQRSSDAHS